MNYNYPQEGEIIGLGNKFQNYTINDVSNRILFLLQNYEPWQETKDIEKNTVVVPDWKRERTRKDAEVKEKTRGSYKEK